mmetsp:Transcript_59978/g.175983  ORF Transcript_59978/g.175983 Transcript_59978/m.175983 type:complete len:349 (+) Transcript_59978:30-1076(+)
MAPDGAKAKKKKAAPAAEEAAKPAKKPAPAEEAWPEGGKEEKKADYKKFKEAKKRRKAAEALLKASATEEPADSEKKGKKAKGKGKDTEPNPGEDLRRNYQREVTQLVVRLRKEGKSEAEIAVAKRELKDNFGSGIQQPDSQRAKKAKAWNEYFKTEDHEVDRKKKLTQEETKHEVVVIPIVWRGRHDREDITKAAEDVKACIAQQNVDCWIDARRQFTPGQKFAHWEHRGVMLRIEVGPEDVDKGCCIVAKAKEAGDYQSVEKKRVRLPPLGSRALLLALKEFGMEKIDIVRREGDSDDEGESAVLAKPDPLKRKGAPSAEDLVDPDLEGNYSPRIQQKDKKKKRKT